MPLPPTVYHGTSLQNWQSIKDQGLIPRFTRNSDGTWIPRGIESNGHLNYLSTDTTLAIFVGEKAAKQDQSFNFSPYVVIEVDTAFLDQQALRADDNWITRHPPEGYSYLGYAEASKLAHCDDRWEESIKTGAVGYEGFIPPEAFVKAIIYESDDYTKEPKIVELRCPSEQPSV